ncbi:MAG TPA: hypothetical protein VHB46_14410 [Burkholderiales bacterium]|nr:hypothetical protein [Burkholderiales bacterium]
MGKKSPGKADADGKGKKRGKKKKISASAIEDALACPPTARFFHELVVGHGIGDNAVEDAEEAYRKALDSRREKALEAAQNHQHDAGKNCLDGEHLVLGPFYSAQSWRIEREDPLRATTWNWIGFQSVHFCRRK